MLQVSAQLLLRTNSVGEFSAISMGSDLKNFNYGERINVEESMYYRSRYGNDDKEKTVYNVFSIFKRDEVLGICPYGMDIDILSEKFEKNRANTFRYWNKIRMGYKFIFETDLNDTNQSFINFLKGEVYMSFLHLPRSARGDQTTKARKGSFMIFGSVTPMQRVYAYMKFNVGYAWIKPYYSQDQSFLSGWEYKAGLNVEVEVNKNGYDHSIVQSSRDVYRGLTVFGGPEYNIELKRIFLNIGVSVTTENH